jgi:20S proteasome subunit alpha 5
MSGFVADSRTLIDHARVETQNHWFTYNERMGIEPCVQSVCDLALAFGEGTMARPFGVALLIGGVDENGPALYHVDPSGTHTQYLTKAIGAGSEGAQNSLKQHYHKSITLEEAKKLVLQILKNVMEAKISPTNVELAVIPTSTGLYTPCTNSEIEAVISTLDNEPI